MVSQLEYAKKDIDTLTSYVTSFINWWSKITTYLNNPQVVLLQIRLDGTLYFPADSVKELLVTLSKGYIQYSEQVRCHHRACHSDMAYLISATNLDPRNRKLLSRRAAGRRTKEGG